MKANFREFPRKQHFTFVFYLPTINNTVTDTRNFGATKNLFLLHVTAEIKLKSLVYFLTSRRLLLGQHKIIHVEKLRLYD